MSPPASPMSPDNEQLPADAIYKSSPDAPTTCRYAGKKCLNLRALKRNGSLHNLCHYHRVRANQNQRRMELRRRIKRVHGERTMGAMVHHPMYAPPMTSSSSENPVSFAALMRAADPHYGHFGGPPHTNTMLPPPPQDHLSDLFSAPEHGSSSYAVDLPYTMLRDTKQDVADLHYHFPTSFPQVDQRIAGVFPSHHRSPLDQQQVVWYDQDLLLPL